MSIRVILYGALAGAVGGAVGWLPGELVAIPRPAEAILRYLLIALYFVLVGGCIGAAIGALDGVVNAARARAMQGGRTGALLGLIGGAVGSLPGEGAFEALNAVNLGLVGRAIGWAIVGVLIGAAQGVITRDRARLLRGGLGGLLGGYLGGYLGGGFFEVVSLTLARGAGSRWIAVVALGAFLGAFITFFQEWLADAWLVVVSSGRQEGQKYNLTKGETVLGRGDRDDFILYASEGVVPRHALIVRKQNGHWIRPLIPEHPVWVNRQIVSDEHPLRHGSEIVLGGMTLRFQEQVVKCPQCGKEKAVRAQFCPGCGKRLSLEHCS